MTTMTSFTLLTVVAIVVGSTIASASDGCTIAAKLKSEESLRVVAKAVEATGFEDALSGPGPTVFYAPTDDAFRKLNAQYAGVEGTEQDVLNMDLTKLLEHHVLASGAPESRVLPRGTKVKLEIQACNGVILVVDHVLVPASHETRECQPGACCDLEPPSEYSCAQQMEWGKCREPWMVEGGYCREICNRCSMESYVDPSRSDNATAFVTNGILYQQWHYLSGSDRVSSFHSGSTRFMRTEPDVSVWIDEDGDFRGLSPNSGWPRTGARMTGFFCAPQDGEYEFYMTSDDSSRLYILDPEEIDAFSATDGFGSGFGPGWTYKDFIINQVPWVFINGWKRPSEWVGPQRGMKVMKKGQTAFLEVHHKNGDGAGHVKLGVVLPGGEWISPIPSYFFSRDCLGETVPAASLP